MKKKLVSILTAGAVVSAMAAGCVAVSADSTVESAAESAAEAAVAPETVGTGSKGTIKIWVADAAVKFTSQQVQSFIDSTDGAADWSYTVEPVGEGDAASNMITDVEAGADIYTFAQDQIARLVAAGALEEVNPDDVDSVKSENDEGAITAATVGDTLYAHPITSDNGYFLYYDKSVVTDPSDLDTILSDCEKAGKNFYMEINNGWYQPAFFFGTGCRLFYETDNDGNFTSCTVDYASDAGVTALKEMIKVKSSSAFQNGSSAGKATNVGAIVDGTWDASTVKELLGDNYACAKLPSFKGEDGKTYQMSGFGGYKLLGEKPQEDEDKLAVCDQLTGYLSGEEVQAARYKDLGWGPSNKAVQASDAVKADEALSALADQLQYDIPQGQYPNDYWTLATGLGDDVIQGNLTADTSDDDLMKALQTFQDTCASYAES